MTFYNFYVIIIIIPKGKFIIESVIKISQQIKNLFNRIKNKIQLKEFLSILILVIITIQIIFYGYGYYRNNNLVFTKEDWFIFSFLIFTIVLLCCLFIVVILDRNKFKNILYKIYEAITLSEDNLVEIQKDTQDMIINIFRKDR